MDINKYKLIITPTAYEEMIEIYDYISKKLYAENAAKKLMKKVEEKIERLKYTPKLYAKIEKIDKLRRNYRRIIINNYIILYTIDEENNTVFISHMYYGRRNYIDNKFL